ncbi:MAG TPA: sialate O-acetylesterase, partial [Tepidisphaeraceae bacterium]
TIRGVLWYQGERNASGPFTSLYGKQLETLIADWCARWGDNFHFSYVQIPSHQKLQSHPSDDKGWAVWVREGQRQTLTKAAKPDDGRHDRSRRHWPGVSAPEE